VTTYAASLRLSDVAGGIAAQVFYTKILEDVDPALAKWKAKTEVK